MNLEKLGIKKDVQYECITTTTSKDGIKNAGAFGFKYLGDDKVFCRIFEGSKTLKNILDTNEYGIYLNGWFSQIGFLIIFLFLRYFKK